MMVACENSPEKQEERASDLIALAEAQIGQPEDSARLALTAEKYKEDALTRNRFVRSSSQFAYIQLNVSDSAIVKTVEAGQDHTDRTTAQKTQKLWSQYTNASVFPETTLYLAQTVSTDGDTVTYMGGTIVPQLTTLVTTLHTYKMISDEQQAEYNATAARNRAQYLLDTEEKAENLQQWEEHFYYAPNFSLELNMTTITKIMSEGLNFRSVGITVNQATVQGNPYYRVVYEHDNNVSLSFGEIVGEE